MPAELARVGRLLLLLGALLGTPGCDGLLDVEDTGRVGDEEVRNATSAELWANGALLAVQRGWDDALLLGSTVSDELLWAGPHGWWGPLDGGEISDPQNAGLNEHYRFIAAGHWMANEAIAVLDSLNQVGDLGDEEALARAYLYGAVILPAIADLFEDFAPSDRTESGPPLGSANMGSLYEGAVDFATEGLLLEPPQALRRNLLAARARARHGRAVWERIRPVPSDVSGEGFVADEAAARDALAALAVDGSDWRFQFSFTLATDELSVTMLQICGGLPNMKVAERYAWSDPPDHEPDSVRILDPVDGVPDPSVERFVFTTLAEDPCFFPDLTVFSAREMRLIVAEDALARGDTTTFAAHVNQVRMAEGLTAWDPSSGVAARDLLVYERQTRLFLTGRRLADLYRFGIRSDRWADGSDAATAPGTLFSIPSDEVERNCHLNGSCG